MSGSIQLPFYPLSNRLPGFFADVDGSRANTALFQNRTVLIGYMLATGQTAPGAAFLAVSGSQVGLACGLGSMAYEMYVAYRQVDTFGEVWILPLPEPVGTAAQGSFTIGGVATQAGLLSLYVAEQLVGVPVSVGDTGPILAARMLSLMGSLPDLPVSATVAGAVVNLTALHKGLLGNDILLQQNYLGAPGGEAAVPGVTVAIAPMANGTGTPTSLAAALTTLGDMTADYIACPFSDFASLTALDAFLVETGPGRWSWSQMLFGAYFTAYRATVGGLASFGQGRNGKFGSCMPVYASEPEPVWKHAANYAANVAVSADADPNQPLQYIALGTLPAHPADRPSASLRNTLLYDGISAKSVNHANQNVLDRACTFYQTNLAGAPDNSFLDVETLYGLAYLLRRWKQRMSSLFAHKNLVDDGNVIAAGGNTVTPKIITTETIIWYHEECDAGNAQNPAQFAKMVLSQNAGNGTVKELLPFILVNQLRQIAALAQFTKP